MSNNSHAKDISPPHVTSNGAKSQEATSSTLNTPGTSNISIDPKEDENTVTNKDNMAPVKPDIDQSKTTDPAEATLNSSSANFTPVTTSTKDTGVDNKSNDKKNPSTYEIDGITYQYGVAYPNRAQPANYQRPKWGVYPNMMSYVDDAGVKHEIHIPTGMYHRAVQLFVAEDWDELGKFPAYEGQKYTEADRYRLDDSDEEGEKCEDSQSATAPGTGDAARVSDGPDTVGKDD